MSAFPRPAVFADESLASALARAGGERRWLVVDVVDTLNAASWAGAYTTWRDPELVEWVENNALSIQIDARADDAALRALGVTVEMAPLVLVLRDGVERLRLVGLQTAAELRWRLERLDVAEDNLQLQRRLLKHPERQMMERTDLAKALLHAGLLADALEQFDWLWRNVARVDPEMAGVRQSFMAGDIAELCAAFSPARARFAELRDAAGATASVLGAEGRQGCVDFVVLNKALGDGDRTLAWFDGLAAADQRALSDGLVDLFIVPLLIARERWADAGALLRAPLEELDRRQTLASIGGDLPRSVRELHRCLRAAGREQDIEALRAAALELDDSAAMRAVFRG